MILEVSDEKFTFWRYLKTCCWMKVERENFKKCDGFIVFMIKLV